MTLRLPLRITREARFCAPLLAAGLAALCAPATAALQSLSGLHFDLQYDDTSLGLYGSPVLVGDTFYFTPNGFTAASANGAGIQSASDVLSGLVVTAKAGVRFVAFELAAFGDYSLSGAGSSVQVLGRLTAFNTALAASTQTYSDFAVNPLTPLTLNDGLNHDWSAAARIDNSSPVALRPNLGTVGNNIFLSNPSAVGLTIDNRLSAYTDPGATGFRQAFIEGKFIGAGVTVSVSPVPLPPSQWLLLAGLGFGALVLQRRRQVVL